MLTKWQKIANCWQRYLPSPTLMIPKRRCMYNPTPITQTKGFYLPTLCLDGESMLGICIISFTLLESCIVARNNTCTKYMKLRWVMMKGENERRGERVVWIYYKYIYLCPKKKRVDMGGLQLSIFDTQPCALQAWSSTINTLILKENVPENRSSQVWSLPPHHLTPTLCYGMEPLGHVLLLEHTNTRLVDVMGYKSFLPLGHLPEWCSNMLLLMAKSTNKKYYPPQESTKIKNPLPKKKGLTCMKKPVHVHPTSTPYCELS